MWFFEFVMNIEVFLDLQIIIFLPIELCSRKLNKLIWFWTLWYDLLMRICAWLRILLVMLNNLSLCFLKFCSTGAWGGMKKWGLPYLTPCTVQFRNSKMAASSPIRFQILMRWLNESGQYFYHKWKVYYRAYISRK
jgi:hypothetical protein